jgi:hypothetical protein
MSRTFDRLAGSGTAGAYLALDQFGYQSAQKLKDMLDLLGLGCFFRNLYGGGSEINGLGVGVGTGSVRVLDSIEIEIDNSGNQVSNADDLVCQVQLCVRVENAGISVTPRVYNLTDASVPSQSGAAACTATAADFSGTNSAADDQLHARGGEEEIHRPARKERRHLSGVGRTDRLERLFKLADP